MQRLICVPDVVNNYFQALLQGSVIKTDIFYVGNALCYLLTTTLILFCTMRD